MTRMARSFGLASSCLALTAVPAHAEIQAARSIPFKIEQGMHVNAKVQEECQLQTRVPAYVAQHNGDVTLVDKPGQANALDMHISEVHAPGGGAFSGPKWLSVRGTLHRGGRVVGTFRAKRITTGGFAAQFKGTCAIIGRAAEAIGKDVAAWLEAPAMDSKLGDAK